MFDFDDDFAENASDVREFGESHFKRLWGFDDFFNFHKSTWGIDEDSKEYDYRVYGSTPTFNMNELLIKLYEFENPNDLKSEKLKQLRRTTFLTGNGLLCKARDFVDFYKEKNQFPRMVVVFDYTETGQRDIADLLLKFEDAIIDMLEIKDIDAVHSMQNLLFKTVDIKLYTKDARATLLPWQLKKRLEVIRDEGSTIKFWALVQRVHFLSSIIRSVQSKSYTPLISFKPDKEFKSECCKEDDEWYFGRLKYQKVNNYMWIKKDKNVNYIMLTKAGCKRVFMQPVTLFSEMDKSTARELIECFSLCGNNSVIEFLNEPDERLLPMQVQLVLSLLSYASFCKFYKEHNMVCDYNIDVERVCMNFGLQSELLDDLKGMFRMIKDTKLNDGQMLYERLLDFSERLLESCSLPAEGTLDDSDFSKSVLDAEEHLSNMYHAELLYEAEMEEGGGCFSPDTLNVASSSLVNFINGANKENNVLKTLISTMLLINTGYAENGVDLGTKKETVKMLVKAK